VRNIWKIWVRNPKGKIPLEKLIHRWKDKSKMDLKIRFKDMKLIHLAHNRAFCI
jgi:PIN domain nuclease of toxin-antitoxin system